MKRTLLKRVLSLLLTAAMLLTVLPMAALAAEQEEANNVTFQEISQEEFGMDDLSLGSAKVQQEPEAAPYADSEMVRVSIVLNALSAVEAGFSTVEIAQNSRAQAYRSGLETAQASLTQRISQNVLGGQALDVVWNLTLAANVISANVPYGKIEAIKALPSVQDVVLETQYSPCEAEEALEPNNGTSTVMTGASTVWASGYTGAGTRIAIIDTGLDTDHEAVDNGAFLYALADDAKGAGVDKETYVSSLNLLDAAEIQEVLTELNIYKGYVNAGGVFLEDKTLTADSLYINEKIPFAYNYVDRDLQVTHDNDNEGAHGSHVAGIAAANRYVPQNGSYVPSMESTYMVGAAPDAQIIVMKVFGKNGGAYDSDYIAAIEDAVLLGCDVANLSLGSNMPGFTVSQYYQETMDKLSESDIVISISAGNSSSWPAMSANGYLYAEDVNYHTGGYPGAYSNAFTVGSVDNAGLTGECFTVQGREESVVYREYLYNNPPLSDLDTSEDGTGTEYGYVFLDSLGKLEDYDAAGIESLDGKVVFVQRGEIEFGAKMLYAKLRGASACIICNNVPGAAMAMDLSAYPKFIPCVSISQSDANGIRAASTPVTDDGGNVLYYTGTMTVGSKMGTSVEISENNLYTMSTFSSWGVPGDLSIKPEITAPGGNIRSINGATPDTDQYVIMGGTSMASPHNAGLAALLCQYFKETGLTGQVNLSPRVLAQSLLMSTAMPVVNASTGLPYPVIQQGAGLGNVQDAMNASAYVLVDGQSDGKVKAELGDDPDRTGVYTFAYTIYNLENEDREYTLDADVYTQNSRLDEDGQRYTGYDLQQLSAVTGFSVDGREIVRDAGDLEGLDFNGDGKVNEADGNALLAYAVGNLETLTNLDKADLSGDGKITAYDAELFLDRLGKYTVTLPAGGSLTVTVTITLTAEDKAMLDETFPNGAYIEAYVYAIPFATAEGVLASGHSIPVLAFYGGWDEPNMFDPVTYTEWAYGTNDKISYMPADAAFNFVAVSYGDDDSDGSYYLGGNLYAVDDEYLEARNAIRSNNGDAITGMDFCLIRAAGGLRASISNAVTGEVYASAEFDHVYPTFYNPGYGWTNYLQAVVPTLEGEDNWMVTDAEGNLLKEGTILELKLQAAPEYFLNDDGATVDWDTIASENALTMQVAVDNTAPKLKSVSKGTEFNPETGDSYDFVEVVAVDNRYTAAVLLLTPGGTNILDRKSANQTALGAESRVRLDITGVYGSSFKLAVVDYAGNATYYNVQISEPFQGPTATLYGASAVHAGAAWHSFTSDTNYDYETLAETKTSIYGAVYGSGYVFYVADNASNGYSLYVTDFHSFTNPIEIGAVSGATNRQAPINYLTYNTDDQSLYHIKNNSLYRLDVGDATETLVATIDSGDYNYLWGMDYSSEDGCFYVLGSKFYYDHDVGPQFPTAILQFALPEEGQETVSLTQAADLGIWTTFPGSLVLDELKEAAYIVNGQNSYSELLTYEFEKGTLTATGRLDTHNGVFMPDGDDREITREQPTSVTLSNETLNLFAGGQKQLTAEVGPWLLQNKNVVWSSLDESIATVDKDGVVTGVKEGTAIIRAASVLDETVYADCTVTVLGANFTLQGVGTAEKGSSVLFTYDLAKGTAVTGATVTDGNDAALPVENASVDSQGILWVQDRIVDENEKGYRLHTIDPVTGQADFTSPVNASGFVSASLLFSDLAVDDSQNVIMAVNGDKVLHFSSTPADNDVGSIRFKNIALGSFVGVATGETWKQSSTNYTRFYALDTAGRIVSCDLSYVEFMDSWSVSMMYFDLDKELTFTQDANGVYQDTLLYHAETGALLLAHYTAETTEIYAIDLTEGDSYSDGKGNVVFLGALNGFQDVALYCAAYTGAAEPQEPAPVEAQVQGEEVLASVAGEAAPAGSLNAFPNAAPSAGSDDGLITVTVRAEAAAKSGMLDIALGEGLTLVNVASPALLSSWNLEGSTLHFAYAGTKAIATGDVIAVLTLTRTGNEETTVTVTETERGGRTPGSTESVVIPGEAEETIYTVIFDSQGGTPVETQYVKAGDRALAPLVPTKEGYRFCGWYTDPDCTHAYSFGWAVNSDLTLYAKWEPDSGRPDPDAEIPIIVLPVEPNGSGSSQSFVDVPKSHWAYDAVTFVTGNGWFNGVDRNHFAPEGKLTRAMLVTVLWRMEGEPAAVYTGAFSDVPNGKWFTTAVEWAAANGIVNGTGAGFDPDGLVTREQIATILWRLSGEPAASGSLSAYPDGAQVSAYAKEAMAWAVESGLFQGNNMGCLNPVSTATRAEAAALLQRYAQ